MLKNGTAFVGTSIGSEREVISEIVFNTPMTGYLEMPIDPSYAGQAVITAYPLIGNYEICYRDMESAKPWPGGYVVRELPKTPSNFRSEDTIQNFLREHNIPGICGIDIRVLTEILREKGIMNDMITTKEYTGFSEPIRCMKEYTVTGVALKTIIKETYVLPGNSKKVALLGCGTRRNITRSLNQRGCGVTVYSADIPAEKVLTGKPNDIMLSNGPRDPKKNTVIMREVKKLCESDVLIFTICLGYQLITLANGMDIHRLEYGHGGGNHSVKDLEIGRVYISSQNRGYVVDMDNLDPTMAVPAFVNADGNTSEGLRYVDESVFTMQYHPETCLRSLDSGYLSDHFLEMMEVND